MKPGTMLRVDGIWVAVTASYADLRQTFDAGPVYTLPEFEDYDDGSPISVDLNRVSMFKPIKELFR